MSGTRGGRGFHNSRSDGLFRGRGRGRGARRGNFRDSPNVPHNFSDGGLVNHEAHMVGNVSVQHSNQSFDPRGENSANNSSRNAHHSNDDKR